MSLITVNCIIRAGQALSESTNCSAGAVVRIQAPPAWTSANLSFQVCNDGNNYTDLFTRGGTEYQASVRAGTSVIINPAEWSVVAFNFLRLRSGTRGSPIPQAADRVFVITLNDGRGPAVTTLPA
jgi:hypothetical protein